MLTELVGPVFEKQPAIDSQITSLAPVLLQPLVAGFSPSPEIIDLPESDPAGVPRREAPKPAIELQMPELVKQSAIMADANTNFWPMDAPPRAGRVPEGTSSFEPTSEPPVAEILQDLKKIEITVRYELVNEAASRQAGVIERAEIQDSAKSEPASMTQREASDPAIELQIPTPIKQSAITTDALTNVKQTQLTSGAIPLARVLAELKSSSVLKDMIAEVSTPSAPALEASQQLLEGAAPPPSKERELTKQAAVVALKPAIELQIPEPVKQSVITTDAIASLKETPLTPRTIPLARVLAEVKTADRPKNDSHEATTSDARVANSASQFANPGRAAADPVEQVRPAQPVQIPDMPKLQTVRTVAMEVGEAGSQVLIRIEERGSGVNLHFGTGNETLHQSIASSVESLVHALRQEKIEISNVEVLRKSPIDKVRRMKEAH